MRKKPPTIYGLPVVIASLLVIVNSVVGFVVVLVVYKTTGVVAFWLNVVEYIVVVTSVVEIDGIVVGKVEYMPCVVVADLVVDVETVEGVVVTTGERERNQICAIFF